MFAAARSSTLSPGLHHALPPYLRTPTTASKVWAFSVVDKRTKGRVTGLIVVGVSKRRAMEEEKMAVMSLSDMVLGFFEEGERKEGKEWGRDPLDGRGGWSDEEDGSDGSESNANLESKAFWETQHLLLQNWIWKNVRRDSNKEDATACLLKMY